MLEQLDWGIAKLFWDWEPTWQQSASAVQRMAKQVITIGYMIDGKIAGYACYDLSNQRVIQFAVSPDFRHSGVATSLFAYLSCRYDPMMSVINVDSSAEQTVGFLQKIGLREFIQQFEMVLKLASKSNG